MAKSVIKEKEFKYEYKSQFGSHKEMINEEETQKLQNPKLVVCKDEFGFYTTEISRLDNGLADPNRWATSRLVGKLLT